MAEEHLSGGKKKKASGGKKNRKLGRNSAYCTQYKNGNQRIKNKARKQKRHFKRVIKKINRQFDYLDMVEKLADSGTTIQMKRAPSGKLTLKSIPEYREILKRRLQSARAAAGR